MIVVRKVDSNNIDDHRWKQPVMALLLEQAAHCRRRVDRRRRWEGVGEEEGNN